MPRPTAPARGAPGETAVDEVFVVRGGACLEGEVTVPGAKNSALKLMAASLLAPGTTTLHNVPAIADVPVMADILRGLGAEVALSGGTCRITWEDVPAWHAPPDAVSRIRASISTLGPLVGRVGRARLALPGGDDIGARSIDMHLDGLARMGAEISTGDGTVEVVADELSGVRLTLDFPSVGATENLVMAAVLADGVTEIENAAREPEVQDLCRMLVAMGASIDGIGDPTVRIGGVDALEPVTWRTCPDRIEAGTWAVAAAVTGGDVRMAPVRCDDLRMPLLKLEAAGARVERGPDHLRVTGGDLAATDVVTLPYPGFPTDLQAQMMVLLSQADGTSMCTENVFESRFSFVEELRRMGADVEIEGHHALIRGPRPLRGALLRGLDVRAGAAGVIAGLVAEGTTVVTDVHHVDRGYGDLAGRLRALGAQVHRRPASRAPEPG